MDELRVYTVEEVAEIMKMSIRTIREYIKGGELKASKFGKAYRITDEDLRDFASRGSASQKVLKERKQRQKK